MAHRVASTVIGALVGSLLTVPVDAPSPTTIPQGLNDPATRLVFMRDCDVWIARPDGSDATNLTADVKLCAIQPSISRTGRYVAWAIGAGSGSEVWVHDRETGSSSPVAAALGGRDVDFSPTTDALAFTRFDPTAGATNIFSIEVDGSGLKQWTFDSGDSGFNLAPSWSADGSSILHTTSRGSWSCLTDRGGYFDIAHANWLARAGADGADAEVVRSDAFSVVHAAEGGGVLAYVRQPLPPGPSGGSCGSEIGVAGELVVNGEVVDTAATVGGVSVSDGGDVAYLRGEDVVVLGAGGAGEVATFRGLEPSWGVDYRAGAGGSGASGGDDGDDPPPLRLPVARCDVYWTTPGSLLRVPQSRGLLANDHDPEGRTIRPLVTVVGFRKSSHPYTVSRDGSFVLRTLSSDRRIYLDYQVKTSDGRRSATARANIVVSRTKPAASQLQPCPPLDDVVARDLRAGKRAMPTAFPAVTAQNLDLLRLSMRSWDDWQHMLKNKAKAPYRAMDFTHDKCSAPLNVGNSWLITFTSYCVRHDFAYRNGLWLGRFNEIQLQADRNFLADMMQHCERYDPVKADLCGSQALAFYLSVRKGGGFGAPQVRKSWAGAGTVRIVTVFTPVDNFYVRGWVRDDKKDGADVRVEFQAAVTGFNQRYRTLAETSSGQGTRATFDYSYNGRLNLKGIYFRICTVDDGARTCGPRFYVNKPD